MLDNLVPLKGNFFGNLGTIDPDKAITGKLKENLNTDPTKKHVTQILSYPESVSSDPMQGHYIIFEILTQNKAEMSGKQMLKDITTVATRLGKQVAEQAKNMVMPDQNIGTAANRHMDSGIEFGGDVGETANAPVDKNKPNSIQIANQATTKLSTVIALYMPPSVSVEYKMNYNEHEIGAAAEGANAMINALSGGDWEGVGMSAAKTLGSMGASIGKTFVDNMPGMQGTSDILQIRAGSIMTPRMELMFEGLSRRNFSYNFTFLPKSVKEAETVEEIVKLFKFHAASDYGGVLSDIMGGADGVRTMTIPDLFDIKYMYMGSDNTHLNKIKTCVLSNISVEYGAERYTAYDGGRPQTTKLALSFTELELITKTYIADGY
jgi:hypothetical protein